MLNNITMKEKKPIPVKYFYYGMLACVLFIGGVLLYLFQKEANEEKLLEEKGIVAEAWITNLYSSKTKKKAKPNYYMEVAFFTNGKPAPKTEEVSVKEPKSIGNILANRAIQTKELSKPLGDYETQTIAIGGYDIYKQYQINDRVNIIFLKENPSILRIKN